VDSEVKVDAEQGFIEEAVGPEGLFGVFEDDGETGYLYIYRPGGKVTILETLHVYDRSTEVQVSPGDVEVVWSQDHSKLAVKIWNKIRGIIDVDAKQRGRVWLETRESPGVVDTQRLKGF
jgi:hypothetical protein